MAYAAVVSLAQILKQLLISPDDDDPILQNSKPLIESLHGKLSSLKLSLEKLFPAPKSSWSTTDDLETRIRDTVYKAQDSIEYLLIQPERPDASSAASSLVFLQETIADIDSITKTADEIQVSIEGAAEMLSEKALPDTKISDDELVGQEKYLEILKGMLLQDVAMCLILPIVGMAGIGKTTLAKRIYNNPLVLEHFDARAWVTISPEHRIGCCVDSLHQRAAGGASEIFRDETSYHSPLNLFKGMFESLFMKKYVVVIDDIWDTRLWSFVAATVTDNNNGSRIILTTTNAELATYTHSSRNMLRDPFLNDDASWELLRRVVFDQKLSSCPSPQLERIGRKISNNCEGHPLAIIEVGKLLRGIEPTVANWKAVEEDENPLIIGANDDTPLSKALTSSYKRLPPYLKACFLYMGLLRRNTEIHSSKLIKLWVSEGFVERAACPLSLRKKANMCLDDLVTKSLVIVRKLSSSGQTKSCGMHFVFRGLCISEARREDFFHIIKKLDDVDGIINRRRQQRICFHNNIVLGFKQVHESMDSILSARSIFCFGPHHQYPIKVHFPFKLLRVLDSIALRFYMFPNQVFGLVRLRYLAITYDGDLPPSISMLINLEVLVVRRHHHIFKSSANYLPIEIWNLRKLKHLYCMGSDLVDPSRHKNGLHDDSVVLENLLTLSGVSAHSCVRGVLSRMPKLTKISIRVVVQSTTHIDNTFSFFRNFNSSLFDDNIDSFKCVVVNPSFGVGVVSPSISPCFSIDLSKLTLSGCGFAWENMKAIAVFPYLVELKVRRYAFRGPVWEVDPESEFLSLECLLLEDLDVECLNGCFPALLRLTIRHCYKLLHIDPHLMSELWRLDMIEVDDCSPATEIWARQIGDKAKDEGHRLKVHIHSSRDAKNKPN